MIFNKHSDLRGKHCIFSPSKPGWINYTVPKAIERMDNEQAKTVGTIIHEFAAMQIFLRHKITNKKELIKNIENYIYQKYFNERYQELDKEALYLIQKVSPVVTKVYETIKTYVNDSIGFKMEPEQVLYYSENFFGTADAIIFRDKTLRIHDLKTGTITQGKMEQLMIYAALFCLEYEVRPGDIEMELRIYQLNDILVSLPQVDEILPIMDHIKTFDKAIARRRKL